MDQCVDGSMHGCVEGSIWVDGCMGRYESMGQYLVGWMGRCVKARLGAWVDGSMHELVDARMGQCVGG